MSYVLFIVSDLVFKQLHTEYFYAWWTVCLVCLSSGKHSKHKKIISASGRLMKLMPILDIFIDFDLPLHKSFYRGVWVTKKSTHIC